MAKSTRQRSFFEEEEDAAAPPKEARLPVADPTTANSTALAVESLADQTVLVVDAHSLIYQVFHAMPEMTGPAGQPVGAIHGFTRDILDLLEKLRPQYLFCAFDPPGDTFRHQVFPEYKAQREAMPDDLQLQIPNIHRMLAALGVPNLECPGYEADDVLATVARAVTDLKGTCLVVSGDKDCRQLINDHVRLYNIRKSEAMDAQALLADWGVQPDQVVDYQALVGDSVDNVPGVPLIGPKIARDLIQKYHTLENILEHAEEINGKKRRENLVKFRDQALLSQRLVRLDAHAPIEINWAAGRVAEIDVEAGLELCREFGFRTLAERIAGVQRDEAPAARSVKYRRVESLQELAALANEMHAQTRLAIDTETTSTNPRFADIVGYSLAWKPGEAYYVPVRAPLGQPRLDGAAVAELLKPLLEDERIEKIGQNLKYELVVLRSLGIRVRGPLFDTMVADYLLDPGQRNHSLDDLAKRYLNHVTIKISELIGTGKNQKRMDEVPVDLVTDYACEDADVPLQLADLLERRLDEQRLADLFRDLEMPLVKVLAELEFNGIKVDVARLKELSDRFGQHMAALEGEIHALAGGPFNIDSRLQLADVLFAKLQLPVVKKTKTGPSTDASVLSELAPLHPLPAKVIEYRQNAKLKSTYVDALPQLVHPETGRVHTSFKQDVAATGRLSSTEPNLQNIPVRTAAGREIRSAFLPGEPGWSLLTADYSQIELRVLAHFSADDALQEAFADDLDIHQQVASEVYGTPLAEVTPEMRRRAKAVNFGVIYGQSAFGLAKALGIDQEEAATFIDTYFERYSGVDNFIKKVLEECRKNGYVSTILGRRRAVQGVRDPSQSGNSRQRNLPERIAINTVIQGSAADLIKQAMIKVHSRMQRDTFRARILLQIHDELVFEFPSDEQSDLVELVTEEMTSAGCLDVPLKVDIKTGPTWAACEAI
jgi:DNA polymerase-1